MNKLNFKNLKPYLIGLASAYGTGALSALVTMSNMDAYEQLKKPPLSPPSWVFGVVWFILFTLMGISAGKVIDSPSHHKKSALTVYAIQLFVNFLWTVFFFSLRSYLFSFIWLLVLILWIIYMISEFSKIDKKAAWLQIPYLLWSLFAAYLNLLIFLLNK